MEETTSRRNFIIKPPLVKMPLKQTNKQTNPKKSNLIMDFSFLLEERNNATKSNPKP
jgi:hypothetical protein